MLLSQKLRISPADGQQKVLWDLSEKCRLIYNFALTDRIENWKQLKGHTAEERKKKGLKWLTYTAQSKKLTETKKKYPDYKWVYSKVLQVTLQKLDRDYKSFFALWKKGDAKKYTVNQLYKRGYREINILHGTFLQEKFGEVGVVYKISEPDRKPNIADLLFERKIDFIINIPSTSTLEKYVGMLYDEYQIRRKSLELGIPVLTTIELAESFVKTLDWLQKNETTKKPLEPYNPIN